MGELEALGDAVTAGVVGRAVEPAAGEGDGHTEETHCLNCGAALAGAYCHACGQHAHVHRTLAAFFHDFLHGVLHFEGKIWRTLPLLAWTPGELTRRYIAGERARFISPIALFLFSVFLMFAALSATGNGSPNFGNSGRDLAVQQRESETRLAKLHQTRSALAAKKLPTTDIDADIAETAQTVALIKTMRGGGVSSAVLSKDANFQTKLPMVQRAFNKAKENPDLLLYKLKSNSYKWSWAIIPLSVPFMWLLFPFSRRFRVYDHVVFVTYSVAFMSLLVSLGVVVSAIGINATAPLLLLVPPVHMYRQLRGAYGLTRFGTIWRTALLLLFAVVVLSAFILLMGALGLYD